MNSKQLNTACIEKIKELAPEVYKNELHITRPFFTLNSLLFNKGEKILSEDYKLTQSELDILASLYFSETDNFSLTPTQLKDIMFFTSGGMTKLLKKLEEKEYIIKIDNEADKRSKSIQITESGIKITSKALKDIIEFESSYFSKLNHEEQKQFKNLLYKVLN